MKKFISGCSLLLVAFGILSFTYAVKSAVIENVWIGSLLYLLSGILCAVLMKVRSNQVSHIDLSFVLIAFFTACIINGNLTNVAWVVTIICMCYLLIEVLTKDKRKKC